MAMRIVDKKCPNCGNAVTLVPVPEYVCPNCGTKEERKEAPERLTQDAADQLMASAPEDEQEVFHNFLDDAIALNWESERQLLAKTPSGLLISAIIHFAAELERREDETSAKKKEAE